MDNKYKEWDKIMTNEDENCDDDLLQGKFKHFKGCITTDGKDVEDNIDVDVEKVIQKVYHTKELQTILDDIIKDFIEQVVLMDDRELKEDRSEWLKVYSGYDDDGKDEYKYDTCIHTLAIEIEQLRRYGEIVYDVKDEKVRFD